MSEIDVRRHFQIQNGGFWFLKMYGNHAIRVFSVRAQQPMPKIDVQRHFELKNWGLLFLKNPCKPYFGMDFTNRCLSLYNIWANPYKTLHQFSAPVFVHFACHSSLSTLQNLHFSLIIPQFITTPLFLLLTFYCFFSLLTSHCSKLLTSHSLLVTPSYSLLHTPQC